MSRLARYSICLLLFFSFQLLTSPAIACIEGLSWGMDRASVEQHLGVTLMPTLDEANKDIFEIRDFQMSTVPVQRLLVRIEDQKGLRQLAYEMDYNNMTEVLAGLRNRFGPPVAASIDVDGISSQQQWTWHTGEDVITAIKSDKSPFLLSYRPSRLDLFFLG